MAAKTLSFGKGKGNVRHNNREYVTDNVDKDRIENNITYVKQDLRDAYVECFQKSIDEYNAKQTRQDRMKSIDGYMDEIKRNQANRNGEKLFYEQVVGIGDMYDSGILTAPQEAEKCKEVLDQYAQTFQQRNPHLHVFNMVLHMDEQTPHLHIDYIPVAEGYKQGLQVRNSLSKALENQGLRSAKQQKDNNTISWQNKERAHITNIAQEHDIQIYKEGIERKDMTLDQYKTVMKVMDKQLQAIPKEEVNRVNLPFGLKLETYGQSQKIDQALERKAMSRSIKKAYESATIELKNESARVGHTLKAAVKTNRELEEKVQLVASHQVQLMKKEKELDSLIDSQRSLNASYNQLKLDYSDLKKENEELQVKVKNLNNALTQRFEDALKPYTEEVKKLKTSNKDLKERLDGVCQSLANVTKAFNLLKHDQQNGYKVQLNDKQSRLFTALEKYTIKWLKYENKVELADDVEKNIGLSDGIQKEIKALEPKRSMDRGR